MVHKISLVIDSVRVVLAAQLLKKVGSALSLFSVILLDLFFNRLQSMSVEDALMSRAG